MNLAGANANRQATWFQSPGLDCSMVVKRVPVIATNVVLARTDRTPIRQGLVPSHMRCKLAGS
jgi:hypothetical protein